MVYCSDDPRLGVHGALEPGARQRLEQHELGARIADAAERLARMRVPVETSIAGTVVREGRPLRIDDAPVYAAAILPTIVLLGLGFALAFPSLNIQATAGVADHERQHGERVERNLQERELHLEGVLAGVGRGILPKEGAGVFQPGGQLVVVDLVSGDTWAADSSLRLRRPALRRPDLVAARHAPGSASRSTRSSTKFSSQKRAGSGARR